MTHCSCIFLVCSIHFAVAIQSDLPITCTNCILNLIYIVTVECDATLNFSVFCKAYALSGCCQGHYFILQTPYTFFRYSEWSKIHFSGKQIVRILKTITYRVNRVEWQPLQINSLHRKCMQILRKSQQSWMENENIYSNQRWVQSIEDSFFSVRFAPLCLSGFLC